MFAARHRDPKMKAMLGVDRIALCLVPMGETELVRLVTFRLRRDEGGKAVSADFVQVRNSNVDRL